MVEDRLDRIEKILERVAREQELFAKEMRALRAAQKELQASQKKTDEQLRKTDEQLKKTDEQLRKTDEQLRKTDEQLRKVSQEVGGIGGGLGRVAEGLTIPSVPKVFKKLGIKVEAVYSRVKALQDGQVKDEIDILCPAKKNGVSLVLVGEVKAHLTTPDVQDFLNESLALFRENFPDWKDRELIAFVAGLKIEEDTIKFAQKSGLYVLIPSQETMRLANTPEFKPKVW